MSLSSPRTGDEVDMAAAFWRFIAARQQIFERRRLGKPAPWTNDRVLAQYRFTNVYRASDRVSQYLIRHVLYNGPHTKEDEFFRCMLFRMFNHIPTWELLTRELGEEPRASNYVFGTYAEILTRARARGETIFGGAYIIPAPKMFGYGYKHGNILALLDVMMDQQLWAKLRRADSLEHVYLMIHEFPLCGEFIAMQHTADLNYGTLVNFNENDFVVAGLGAKRGVAKLLHDLPGLTAQTPEAEIHELTEDQDLWFDALEIQFPYLGGSRRLTAMDIQNCLCEFDKYCRVAYPHTSVTSRHGDAPMRIKRGYDPAHAGKPIEYCWPPKWGI